MFSPLAFTKTRSMAVAAGLGITTVPVLMGFSFAGKSRMRRQTRSTAS